VFSLKAPPEDSKNSENPLKITSANAADSIRFKGKTEGFKGRKNTVISGF
jgi:hypothetical protein